jgi:protocatechuate 3,4-dioxygenase beta subunit
MRMPAAAVLLLLLAFPAPGAAAPGAAPARERVVGGACEGCESVFIGMPAHLGSGARLTPPGMAGEALQLEGTVKNRAGKPVAGIIVYAYQTNAQGAYPPDERTRGTAAAPHGSLRGWARSDAQGRYRFLTIRPGGYPDSEDPQHIHLHVIEPGRCTYWIDGVHFDDDPRLTRPMRLRMVASRGGRGIVVPARDANGLWHARRDIQLGQGIPDYRECGAARPTAAAGR